MSAHPDYRAGYDPATTHAEGPKEPMPWEFATTVDYGEAPLWSCRPEPIRPFGEKKRALSSTGIKALDWICHRHASLPTHL